MALDNKMKVL